MDYFELLGFCTYIWNFTYTEKIFLNILCDLHTLDSILIVPYSIEAPSMSSQGRYLVAKTVKQRKFDFPFFKGIRLHMITLHSVYVGAATRANPVDPPCLLIEKYFI